MKKQKNHLFITKVLTKNQVGGLLISVFCGIEKRITARLTGNMYSTKGGLELEPVIPGLIENHLDLLTTEV